MYIALIDEQTNIVENIVEPPNGSNVWFVPEGKIGVLTEVGAIGDTWDGQGFVKPAEPETPAE